MALISGFEIALPPGSRERDVAEAEFERLGAADYITAIREPADIQRAVWWDATLEGPNISIHYKPLDSSGMLVGNKYAPQIWVDSRIAPCAREIAIAHELGHYFLLYVAEVEPVRDRQSPGYRAQEAFCEYFAHRLIGRPTCITSSAL